MPNSPLTQTVLGLAALAVAIGGAPSHSRAETIIGPGFGATGYSVTTLAIFGSAASEEVNSLPDGVASSQVSLGPFTFGSSFAQDLNFSDAENTDCCGGGGHASGSSAATISYAISGVPANEVVPLTFNFVEHGIIFVTSAPGRATIALGGVNTTIAVSSFKDLAKVVGGVSFESTDSGAPLPEQVKGYSYASGPSASTEGAIGHFTLTIDAKNNALVQEETQVGGEVISGDSFVKFFSGLASVTVPRGFQGPLPELTHPGLPSIQVGVVPEPAVWAMQILGFGLVGAALRARRRTAVPT